MKNFKVKTPGDGYFIASSEVLNHLHDADEKKLKVYLYCSANTEINTDDATKACNITEEEFETAFRYWADAGIFSAESSAVKPRRSDDLIQTYDGETLAKAIEEEPDFASLRCSVEDMLGKVLNKNDISLLYNIYHFSGLGADYVCAIVAYAMARDKGNMRYITKTALSFYDDGADTYEKLEKILSERQRREDVRAQFISLCGFGARKLTSKEEEYIAKWFGDYKFSFDIVRLAYEINVNSKSTVSMKYIDAVLSQWKASNVQTLEDAKAENEKFVAQNKQGSKSFVDRSMPEDTFDVSEFIEAAKKRSVT